MRVVFTEDSAQKPARIGIFPWERAVNRRGGAPWYGGSLGDTATRTRSPLHIMAEPTQTGSLTPAPSKFSARRITDNLSHPPSHQTASCPPMINGTHLESAAERALRDCRLPPGVERITPTYYQPANSSGSSHPPTNSHILHRAPRDEQPPSVVERTTPTYSQPASSPGQSYQPTKYSRVPEKPPRDGRPLPEGEGTTPTYYQPFNPLGPSHRPTKHARVPKKAPREERPPPVLRRIAPAPYQPANLPGPSCREFEFVHASHRAPPDPSETPHEERPPPVVEKVTPTKHRPTNPPGPSHQESKSVHASYRAPPDPSEAPREEQPREEQHRKERHCEEQSLGFGTIVLANPPGPTNPPAKSGPGPNMSINFTQKIPTIVRSKKISHLFTNHPAILV